MKTIYSLLLPFLLFAQFENKYYLKYDGTDYDSVLAANAPNLDVTADAPHGFAIAAWVKITDPGITQTHGVWTQMSSRPRAYLYMPGISTDRWQGRIDVNGAYDGTVFTDLSIISGKWYFVMMSGEFGTATDSLRLWAKDEDGTEPPGDPGFSIENGGAVGAVNWANIHGFGTGITFKASFLIGGLDEIVFFNYPVTRAEFLIFWNNGKPYDYDAGGIDYAEWFRHETSEAAQTTGENGTIRSFPSNGSNQPTYTSLNGENIYVESTGDGRFSKKANFSTFKD